MSVEDFLGQSHEPPRLRGILTGSEFLNGNSRMRALADSLSNEGHRGIVKVYDEVAKTGKKMASVPLGLTLEQANRLEDNGAGVLWGAMFRTFDRLMKDGKFDPNMFVQLLKNGFLGTRWADSIAPVSHDELFFTPESLMPLASLATQDKTLSFLATDKGLSMLPIAFSAEVVRTGYSERLRGEFVEKYKPLAQAILELPKTPFEIATQERRYTPDIRPLTFS